LRQQLDFRPARLGLAEVCLAQGRWAELDEMLGLLGSDPAAELDTVLLRARVHRARQEFGSCRQLLEQARQRWPDSLPLLIQYSYLLLREGQDHALADRVLTEILARDPANQEARNNRRLLHHRAGWAPRAAG
jgi:hypothetical protein